VVSGLDPLFPMNHFSASSKAATARWDSAEHSSCTYRCDRRSGMWGGTPRVEPVGNANRHTIRGRVANGDGRDLAYEK
jgi:hypothetical protein